jgi:hypothetical protein
MTRSSRRCAGPECPQLLPETARLGTRFCSPACRQRAYRRRETNLNIQFIRLTEGTRRCDFCNVSMSAARRIDARYCSARCRQRSYRVRLGGQKLREGLGINVIRRRGDL